MDSQPQTVTHYAILIGIDDYPGSPLKGCVRDVQEVKERLESTLHNAVRTQMITTSRNDGELSELADAPVLWPTYDNVVLAFERSTSLARAGDFIYIHFSGHGTRKPPSGEFSNTPTGDVALALLTGREQTQVTYLWGFDLARLLKDMVDKGLVVTVVLDCCFSGSVYRDDEGAGTRFLPFDHEVGMRHLPRSQNNLLASEGSAYRDASALPNWLMNPDRYAILTACGPHEVARELEINGYRRGFMSYFLLEAITSFGLTKRHRDIHQNLCAKMREYGSRRQNPLLYGNGKQAFFGRASQDITAVSIPVLITEDKTLELLAGQAHGVYDGDQFILQALDPAVIGPRPQQPPVVSRVIRARALTSDLELSNLPLVRDGIGWVAHPASRLALQRFPIRLPSSIPQREDWVTALKARSLDVAADNAPFAFGVELSNGGVCRILRASGEEAVKLPQEQTDVGGAADILEHLARFQLASSLCNEAAADSFTNSYEVCIENSSKRYTSNDRLQVKHGTSAELVVKNRGKNVLYVFVYDLGPSWQVENVLRGTYRAVEPRDDTARSTGIWSLKLRMRVPDRMKAQGHRWCDVIIKIIVTSQPTSFDLLELPRLGELVKASKPHRIDQLGEVPEDWAAMGFHIRTSL